MAKLNGLLPRGIGDLGLQFALFFVAYNLYQVARGLATGREELAFANAERIIELQQALGTFFEPTLQQALLEQRWLIDVANFLYVNSHFTVTMLFLAWLYLLRNEAFYFVRNMFMVAMGLALIGYIAYPTAPPRLMPEAGFVDTIATFTSVQQDEGSLGLLVNPYAAVPSMHVAFSLMVAVSAARLVSSPALRLVWGLYPLIVFYAITVTANHFWLDAAAGAAVASLAAVSATTLARFGPPHWAWPEGERRDRELTA